MFPNFRISFELKVFLIPIECKALLNIVYSTNQLLLLLSIKISKFNFASRYSDVYKNLKRNPHTELKLNSK